MGQVMTQTTPERSDAATPTEGDLPINGLAESAGTILIGSQHKRAYLFLSTTAERMEVERANAAAHGVQDLRDFVFVLDGRRYELTYKQLCYVLANKGVDEIVDKYLEVEDLLAVSQAALAEAQRQLAEALPDAERYRWLRSDMVGNGFIAPCTINGNIYSTETQVDAAIDEAKRRQRAVGEGK